MGASLTDTNTNKMMNSINTLKSQTFRIGGSPLVINNNQIWIKTITYSKNYDALNTNLKCDDTFVSNQTFNAIKSSLSYQIYTFAFDVYDVLECIFHCIDSHQANMDTINGTKCNEEEDIIQCQTVDFSKLGLLFHINKFFIFNYIILLLYNMLKYIY